MKQTIMLAIISIFSIGILNAQKQLSGSKNKKRIELLLTEFNNKNYGRAYDIVANKDTILDFYCFQNAFIYDEQKANNFQEMVSRIICIQNVSIAYISQLQWNNFNTLSNEGSRQINEYNCDKASVWASKNNYGNVYQKQYIYSLSNQECFQIINELKVLISQNNVSRYLGKEGMVKYFEVNSKMNNITSDFLSLKSEVSKLQNRLLVIKNNRCIDNEKCNLGTINDEIVNLSEKVVSRDYHEEFGSVKCDSIKRELQSIQFNTNELYIQNYISTLKVNLQINKGLVDEFQLTDIEDTKIDSIISKLNSSISMTTDLYRLKNFKPFIRSNSDFHSTDLILEKDSLRLKFNQLKGYINTNYNQKVKEFLSSICIDSIDDRKTELIKNKINSLTTFNENEVNRNFESDRSMTLQLSNRIINKMNFIYNILWLYSNKHERTNRIELADLSSDFIESNLLDFSYINKEFLIDILNLDVYKFNNLTSIDTPLKKQNFEETIEFKKLLREIVSMKSILETSNLSFTNKYTNNPDYFRNKDLGFLITSSYDLKNGGFVFRFNNTNDIKFTNGTSYLPQKSFRCINGVDLFLQFNSPSPLITPKKYLDEDNLVLVSYHYGDEVFIPVTKSLAPEIESNPADVQVRFIALGKLKVKKYSYKEFSFDSDYKSIDLLTTDKVRMIVSNIKSNKIYFDKIF